MPLATEDFVTLVERSGLLTKDRFDAYLSQLGAQGGAPEDPTILAQLMVEEGLLSQFQAKQLLTGKWRGFFLGKYKVLNPLESGGYGNVLLCENPRLAKKVAVKLFPSDRETNEGLLARFYREARAAFTRPSQRRPHFRRLTTTAISTSS